MPVSSSETRRKWRKRKRDSRIRKLQNDVVASTAADDDDEELEDDEENNHHLEQQEPDEDPTQQPEPKNNKPSDPRESEVLSGGGVRISDFPTVVKHAVNRPHSSVLNVVAIERAIQWGESSSSKNGIVLENVSYGQMQALSTVPGDGLEERESGGGGVYVITPPKIVEGCGVVKRFGNRVHVVPMHADWFLPNTVHRLERQVVPHFFSGKSVDHPPEKYMECRNFVVAKYMENPEKRLSLADCQGLVVGADIDDLTRIFRFLDHWGIINYCAAASHREPQSDGTYLSEDTNSELHVPVAALKSIDSLIQFDKPKCRLKAADVYPELRSHVDQDYDLDDSLHERLSENRCKYCSQPLPNVYYQSQKEDDVLLCFHCFHEGRFVNGHSSLDFTRANSMEDYGDLDAESWTNQETLLLLEAMELYQDNWNEVVPHVGTKSKAQCMLEFLRMSPSNLSLEKMDVSNKPVSSNLSSRDDHGRSHLNSNGDLAGSSPPDADSNSMLHFANRGNPVMSLVSFLSWAVGPRVAAACAHACLAALSDDDRSASSRNITPMDGSGCGWDGGPHGEITNSSLQKEESSTDHDAEVAPLSTEKVNAAVNAGLSAASTKAKLFADHEEREIQRLSANIINHQLKRLELKLKQFAEVETLLMKECEQLERGRQRLAAERALIVSNHFGPAGVTRPTGLPGLGPAMVNNNTGNNRQQVVSGSPSQPFISGYGNNQPIHPHMSHMPQQSMYGLGPRLPLSAIHPSSSASSTVFNAAANVQPAIGHPLLRSVSGSKSGLG